MWSLPQAIIIAGRDDRHGHDVWSLYDRPDAEPLAEEPVRPSRPRPILAARIRRLFGLAGA